MHRDKNETRTQGEADMLRRTLLSTSLISLMLAATLSAPAAHGQFDAMSLLRRTLGMSEDQMEGGLGSILTLAQEKLAAGDFDKIASAIPGASGYLEKAKELGAVVGPIGNVEGLNGALGRLGIDQETAEKFVPAVKDLVSRLGGQDVGNLLSGVLGG
jgi:hypothetical protein